jgi:transposase
MLGKRSPQMSLFQADHLYLDYVGRKTFYGFLAQHRGQLFRDEDFSSLYCPDNGRNSVPPSTLCVALLLQSHDKVSDEETVERAKYDVRWKVALGAGIEDQPFAKSTLQVFRGQLVLHEGMRAVFQTSLALARQVGYLKRRTVKAVLDTTNILGRGAVKDTYNLLADGIGKLVGALAAESGGEPQEWAQARGLARYYGSSIKGEASIEWDDERSRRLFLSGIVADADRLLGEAREALSAHPQGSDREQRIVEAAALLSQLLCQDVERREDGAAIRQGVARDRVVSVHDPEMRHGHKSKRKRFDGHKVAIAVDPETQLITAAMVLPGNAPDADRALELVEQAEENTGADVSQTIGDCAYGDGVTRQAFADAGRELVARVPGRGKGLYFAKEDFVMDLDSMTCRCPAGQVAPASRHGKRKDRTGREQPRMVFQFHRRLCEACPQRPSCMAAGSKGGRTVSLHPQEGLLQQARALQRSPEYGEIRAQRQTAEHRLARLVQLGMRKARYFGRKKTLFQLLMASTVANLTLAATKTGLMRQRGVRASGSSFVVRALRTAFQPVLSLFRAWTQPKLAFRLGL